MKKIAAILSFLIVLGSCSDNRKIPDVSGIKVTVTIERFDQGFFAMDSNKLESGLRQLQAAYPGFYSDYMQGILGVSGVPTDTATKQMSRIMLGNYRSLYQVATAELAKYGNMKEDIEQGFRFVKYYFPRYKIPGVLTFVGTLDAPGVVITDQYIAVGLHQYAGKDFPGYQLETVKQLYPDYISRRFEPVYIPANCMKAVVRDLFPDKSDAKPLIEQMIEKGKQWWLLDKFMPRTPDSLKTGYTQEQLKWCDANEGLMWSYLMKNEDLRSVAPGTLQTYLGESPFTASFSQEHSPGNIGQWIGWQIVKKFEKQHPEMDAKQIMQADPQKVLDDSRYKPK